MKGFFVDYRCVQVEAPAEDVYRVIYVTGRREGLVVCKLAMVAARLGGRNFLNARYTKEPKGKEQL